MSELDFLFRKSPLGPEKKTNAFLLQKSGLKNPVPERSGPVMRMEEGACTLRKGLRHRLIQGNGFKDLDYPEGPGLFGGPLGNAFPSP